MWKTWYFSVISCWLGKRGDVFHYSIKLSQCCGIVKWNKKCFKSNEGCSCWRKKVRWVLYFCTKMWKYYKYSKEEPFYKREMQFFTSSSDFSGILAGKVHKFDDFVRQPSCYSIMGTRGERSKGASGCHTGCHFGTPATMPLNNMALGR